MATAPFKFLDSYTSDDGDIFFGREKEIEELYFKILDGNLLIVYGSSGTGKTSLIQCGLAGKFQAADWMPVIIRRGENINDSIKKAFQNFAITPLNEKQSLTHRIKSVYLDYFKPIYLLFDQFEELFIFGSDDEIEKFITDLTTALNAGLSCKFIFIIRGEYLENIASFEESIPDFFNNRIRIERMTRKNALQVITEPCKLFNIAVENDFADKVLDRLGNEKATVELTYLQVYLDKLYKKAVAINPAHPTFDEALLEGAGQIDDVLAGFLDEQIAKTKNPENALAILKSFVSGEGTKKQLTVPEAMDFTKALGKNLSLETVENDIRQFVDLRILKDQDENGKYELRHDALAGKIYEQITLGEKELLEVRQFLINRFADYQKRNILLTDADLLFISPYENKLFLNEEQKQFIEKSKRIARQKRNRRRNIAIGFAIGLIIVLFGFTLFAVKQRNEAIAQTKIAEQKTQEAINQKELAEKSNEIAMNASKQALDAKQFAELQSQIAGAQTKIAEQQALKAEEQSQFATTQQTIAQHEKQVAEQKSKEALQQKQEADSAKTEATRLKLLALSQTLAFKSLQSNNDKQLSALLAYQAFELSANNGGNTKDPQLYSALYENLKIIDPAFQPIVIKQKSEIKAMGLSGSNQKIIVQTVDGLLTSYSAADYSFQNTNRISGNHAPLNTSYISATGKFAITAYDDNSIINYNIENSSGSTLLIGHEGLVRAASFSNDGNVFATGGRDSTVIIWKNNFVQNKIHFDSRIKALSMSSDNNSIAVGCEDGNMYLLNISTGNKKQIGSNAPARIQSVAASKQGNYFAFGSSNSTINIYRTGGTPFKTIADNTGSIDFIAIDENLKVLVTASSNKIIHVYSLNDLALKPIVIKDIASAISSLVLSASGNILISCADNSVREYKIAPEHLQSTLLEFITRNFSIDEWNTYIGSDVPYQKNKPE